MAIRALDTGLENAFLRGGGEMGALIRSHDWARTPLGRPETWPQSLKTAIRIMLTSRQPFWIGWGKELIYFYNDPYKSIIGGRHPWALGRPATEVWREIWSDIGPMLDTAMKGEEGTYVEQQLLIMERNGYPEETYYTFSYSPIPNADGTAGGIICANTDETERVIGERQVTLLRELAAGTADARNWQDACAQSAAALASDPWDVVFALLYVTGEEEGHATLKASCGIDATHPTAAVSLPLQGAAPWPVAQAITSRETQVVSDISARFGQPLPSGPWTQASERAVVLPIVASGEMGRSGALVIGLNPFRLYNDNYRGFTSLIASQIATAISNADAYENERRRAEALAELDRAKTAFFSNVSHEFRTPLALMLGPLEAMMSDALSLPPNARAELDLVLRNGLRLLKLVNSLLDFARIEAGRAQAFYLPTDVATLTADLASNFRSLMEKAGLRLIVDCPPLSQLVHVDREMWEKIVLNLLSNAFKYTLEGEIVVVLKESGGNVVLRVEDTGIGIPASEVPHLFERFHRVEGAGGRSYEGSGIGLALVNELVRLHGGSVSVESQEGAGARFEVRIPMGTAHLPQDHIGAERTLSSTAVRAQAYLDEASRWIGINTGGSTNAEQFTDKTLPVEPLPPELGERPHLLVVDDNADMRDYIFRLLDGRFEVQTAGDGEQALTALHERVPDLVLTDIMMPRLDGVGLLRSMREDPDLRRVPVIALSARAGEDAALEGRAAGADDYLTKPFSARELVARVEGNLKLARTRSESERVLREEALILEKLNEVGKTITSEIDLERAVQVVTDAGRELSGAAFGAFFYNVINTAGESYTLYTLSGAPREAFAKFPQPRNTAVFAPTFNGEGIVRSPDITKDPRFGKNPPYYGQPKGHLPVRSYLAVPVISHSGEVLGGLFFGHPEVGVFDERAERLVAGIAIYGAIAMDKARLYRSAQQEIERRRTTEVALRESEQLLETKVVERTEELITANESLRREAQERERIEEQLRQAQKMEAIGQLTGGIAHDFNNILTIIMGNIELMHRHLPQAAPSRLTRSLENAMEGAKRAATLTQHLLAFARRQPLDPKATDLNKLIPSLSHILTRTLGERIEVETVLAGGLWPVDIDTNQLEAALLNLAVNARDAMPNGGKLTIETANAHLDEAYSAKLTEVIPGQYTVIAVSDTGAGMSKDVVEHAFEPFFTTKPPGQGTGLGLSQVYGFVKQSGGHIKIYSEPSQGTTVKIYLPRASALDAESEPAEKTVPDGHHSETILVVEDEPGVRDYTVGVLTELGYHVIEAPDGANAIRQMRCLKSVALLFTDVGLPDMTGRELVDRLREDHPDLKVLFTTGYARNAIVHHGRLDPGVDMIGKPFTYADLAAKIRAVIDQPKS